MSKLIFMLLLCGVSSLSWADNAISNTTIRNSTVIQAGGNVKVTRVQNNYVTNNYGVPEAAYHYLLNKLVDQGIALKDRDRVIEDWVKKYKELESQLALRSDGTAKQARALLAEGKLDEAEALFKKSLAAKLNIVKEAAADAFSLAKIKMLQLDYLAAKSYYLQATQLDPDNALYLSDLGFYLYTMGEYAEAEPLYQRSLAIREVVLRKDHPEVALGLNNLALLYVAQGKYAEAEPLYQRSLTIWERALGENHPNVATSLSNLAGFYYAQGKYDNAEPLLQRSLAIREKALGKDHPDAATSFNNLAEIYHTQGKYAETESLFQRSLAILEKALGKEHPKVAIILNNLASLYADQGKYTEAEPLYLRSLKISEKTLGKEHPDVAISLNNLAMLYDSRGEYAKAKPLYQRALAILERSLGKGHSRTQTVRRNLQAVQAKKFYPSPSKP